ncbi:WD40/YVTN/BNR-like repeat-containing protein [Aquirufa sp. A-Brett2-W8]
MRKNTLLFALLFCGVSQNLAQWTPITLETKASFRAIRSLDSHIWIAGTRGTVIHSSDGGEHFTVSQVPGADSLDFRDLAILDDKTVLLMSAGPAENGAAKIFRTENSGMSWELAYQIKEKGYFFDAILWDGKQGLVLSDPAGPFYGLVRITDKGRAYDLLNPSSHPVLQKGEAAFAASGSSLQKTKQGYYIVTGGGEKARVLLSEDALNWKSIYAEIPGGEGTGFFSLGVRDAKNLWIGGGNYSRIKEGPVPVLESRDAGLSWSPVAGAPAYYVEKILWADPYWILSGPAESSAFDHKKKQWISLGKSSYHNLCLVGDRIYGVGGRGQIGFISLSQISQLFLSKE